MGIGIRGTMGLTNTNQCLERLQFLAEIGPPNTKRKMRMKYVLKWVGRQNWFREWGKVGPRFTDRIEAAYKFDSKKAAMKSDAYIHPFSMVEVVAIKE